MSKSPNLAGVLALLAAALALLISLPFAAAYFKAYLGSDPLPFWWVSFRRTFPGMLDFASSPRVYQIYGRIFSMAIPVTLPAMLVLRQHVGTASRRSLWGWRLFLSGALVFAGGIVGDYWPDQESIWIGVGFMLELLAIPILWAGAILIGLSARSAQNSPSWIGPGMIGIPIGGLLGMGILAHIPSGPLFGYFIFWAAAGTWLLSGKIQREI